MQEMFLTPIRIPEPPPHTQIHPRCFTCKKFPVCNLREDYLKTAFLMQRILGDPQEDRELGWFDSRHGRLPGFKGYNFHKPEDIFPQQVKTSEGEDGVFLDAKWRNLDIVQFIYMVGQYYVQFNAFYSVKDEMFYIRDGHEVYYNTPYELDSASVNTIVIGLLLWREEMIEKEKENEHYDIINTTYFSATLNCRFYEQEKGLTEEEGIKRMFMHFPHGIPCKDGTYHHFATLHIEPHKVPMYGEPAFAPMPYPIFNPKKCPPGPPSKRREDCNE